MNLFRPFIPTEFSRLSALTTESTHRWHFWLQSTPYHSRSSRPCINQPSTALAMNHCTTRCDTSFSSLYTRRNLSEPRSGLYRNLGPPRPNRPSVCHMTPVFADQSPEETVIGGRRDTI